ncbi:hypothetical protein [Acinetobacter pittii]|uniref:Uncharacterized protein n=1 Tax=Acinetobacter pittii TaxID=48296 RepID=A0A6S4UNV4_ACIPI|nr:hypothetical protein [Acinetobacter pittii]MDX8186265.1 hypothetical protein [Acinetobacter pittii]WPP83243.1 hypothetical protein SOI74_10910 [Acinetobacter pittii]BBQ50060.1 hypothetical protein WP2W18E11_30580 [Acinetobacter pittii]
MPKDKKDVTGSYVEKPKNRLTLDKVKALSGMVVSKIDTSIGKIFLFPLTLGAIEKYQNIDEELAVERIRAFLPIISSLSSNRNEAKITTDQIAQLSDKEIDLISEAYTLSNQFKLLQEGGENGQEFVRIEGESYIEFLDRLLQEEVKSFNQIYSQALSSTQGIFDQVRKSSLELGKSWQQYEQLKKSASPSIPMFPELKREALKVDPKLAEHAKIRAKEYAQDREMIHLTGQMTAQSAKTLQELANAAATLLERLDQRDKEAKNTTKIQLWFAVGSLFVSTLLAIISVCQDYQNNKSGDKWQSTLLNEIHILSKQKNNVDEEVRIVKEENKKLINRIAVMESALKEYRETQKY